MRKLLLLAAAASCLASVSPDTSALNEKPQVCGKTKNFTPRPTEPPTNYCPAPQRERGDLVS